jgi:hypothetical protein
MGQALFITSGASGSQRVAILVGKGASVYLIGASGSLSNLKTPYRLLKPLAGH